MNFHVTLTTRLHAELFPSDVYPLGVFVNGSFAALIVAVLLYLGAATAIGLVVSAFIRSQVAAIFGTSVITLLPAVNFSGLIDPRSLIKGA